jgi:hypothetical protein
VKHCLLFVALVLSASGIFAQTAPPAASDWSAEPSNLNFLGVRPGMTVKEAVAAFNASGLPAFSGSSTPVRTSRFGNDQSGAFEAEYGPSAGPNSFGQPVATISVRIDWVHGRVTSIDAHNTDLTYERVVAIIVSAYGKPELTSDDDPDPDGVIARYAQWSRGANTATDVLRVVQSRPDARYKNIPRVEIHRTSTKRYQFEMKTKTEWSSNLQAAASDPNPGRAYWNLCASQYNVGNQTRAAIACDKAIAADPGRADAYYVKANLLFAQSMSDKSNLHFVPGTAEVLKKYLELAPTGSHAAEVREMLEMVEKEGSKK